MRIFREVTFEIEHTKILDNVNLDIDSGINILQGKNGVGMTLSQVFRVTNVEF